MLTEYELAKTYFPGVRIECVVESVKLLETKAGEKRIQVSLMKTFEDGKLVGVPTWLWEGYEAMSKNPTLQSVKWSHDVKEMTTTIYGSEDSQKPAQVAQAPLLASHSLRRSSGEGEGSESDINYHFVMYVTASMEMWRYSYSVHRMSIFVKFETTQTEMFDKPVDDKQMVLGEDEDDYELARMDATSPARDAESMGNLVGR